ncbi:hypothetical protein ADL22_06325 [Streptomyces sp. NRRL F-4489]|uniref:helix-turn-helix domain-containing protein n=1 Tax=Streptomyces sp. NRRL F-4489 TaxID=1609095 RepID=UPI000749FED3|nr:helix-turn-helix transcriptional regulator [Streptomyces sp. NRRL F-4489]KUL51409.1 hypothetical protein ADL22_06325 [Streptomyces sp. NRRL F-4489]
MTPKDPGPVPCPRPGCPNVVESGTGPGRRRMYCSEACGRAVRKLRSSRRTPDTAAHDADALRLVDDMAGRLDVLRTHIRAGDALAGLRQVVELTSDLECVTAAVVRQARDRGHKGLAIAAALHISVDKVGRAYTKDRIVRKMTQRRGRRAPGPAPVPGGIPRQAGRTDPPAPAARPDQPPGRPNPPAPAARPDGEPRRAAAPPRRAHPGGEGGSGRGGEGGGRPGTESGPPGQDPGTALASALSHLQRTGGTTLRGLAAEARVSASYISRILSGERSPSWKVTRRMVHACGGDPEAIRPLWDAAHGRRPARAGSLHAALRGLYLSAACPAPEQICRTSGNALTAGEFTGLLHGSLVPDWETVGAIVGALRGRPDDIRPLWDHARIGQLARATTGLVPERRTPRAEAFG